MTNRRLRRGRKHVRQQLRQFVSESDTETDYAIMSLFSKERFPIRALASDRGGRPYGHNNTRRR